MNRRDFVKSGLVLGASLSGVESFAKFGDKDIDFGPYYNSDLYSPCRAEGTIDHDQMSMKGRVPEEIDGSVFFNSANNEFEPLGVQHWFDGDGMVHKFSFHSGRAFYRNRYINTNKRKLQTLPWFQKTLRKGLAHGFGYLGKYDLLANDFKYLDTGNTTLTAYEGELYAAWYFGAGRGYVIDPENLKTKRDFLKFGKNRIKNLSAHSKVNPVTGDLFTFSYTPSMNPLAEGYSSVRITRVNKKKSICKAIDIDLPGPRNMHDMGLAVDINDENAGYILVLDLPSRPPFGDPSKDETRIGLIPINNFSEKAIRWIRVDPGYILHVANAYSMKDRVILEATRNTFSYGKTSHSVPVIPGVENVDTNMPFKMHLWQWELDYSKAKLVGDSCIYGSGAYDDAKSMLEFPILCSNENSSSSSSTIFGSRLTEEKLLRMDQVLRIQKGSAEVLFEVGPNSSVGEVNYLPSKTTPGLGYLMFMEHQAVDTKFHILSVSELGSTQECEITLKDWHIPVAFHCAWMEGIG